MAYMIFVFSGNEDKTNIKVARTNFEKEIGGTPAGTVPGREADAMISTVPIAGERHPTIRSTGNDLR
jgi:hypothetical protein